MIVAEEWEERIDAIGRTFLGLSVACARCHDHKFDPDQHGGLLRPGRRPRQHAADRAVRAFPSQKRQWCARRRAEVKSLQDEVKQLDGDEAEKPEDKAKIAELEAKIEAIESTTPHYHAARRTASKTRPVRAARRPDQTKLEYKPGEAIDLCVQIRGNPAGLGPLVPRRFLTVLSTGAPQPFQAGQRPAGTGRGDRQRRRAAGGPRDRQPRLEAPFRPRPGRDAERLRHAGRAAVASGTARRSGGRFIEHGWSLKWLHREIDALGDLSAGQHSRRREIRRRPRQSLAVADEPPPAGRRSLARRDAGRVRQARPARSAARRSTWPTTNNRRRTLYGQDRPRRAGRPAAAVRLSRPVDAQPRSRADDHALQQLFVLNSPFMRQQAAVLAAAAAIAQRPTTAMSTIVRRGVIASYCLPRSEPRRSLRLGVAFLEAQSASSDRCPSECGSMPRCCWAATSSCSSID